MSENLDLVKSLISDLEDKKSNIYFFTIDSNGNPVASIAHIYECVKILNNNGYNAIVLHENSDYRLRFDPNTPENTNAGIEEWLGKEYAELPHTPIALPEGSKYNTNLFEYELVKTEDKSFLSLKVGAKDIIVVPESFASFMAQLGKLTCKKVVLAQCYSFALDLLGYDYNGIVKWSNFGFNDVITTTKSQMNYLKKIFPSCKFHISNVSIPEYFTKDETPKNPIVAIHTRDPQTTTRIFKQFLGSNPLYRFVEFKHMVGMSRENFAKELKECCLAVWVDDDSGFGTFPIEAMKCGVPVIGKIPNLIPDWMVNETEEGITLRENGIWTSSTSEISDLISEFLRLYFEDGVPSNLYDLMDETVSEYTHEKQTESLLKSFETIIKDRIEELNNIK